MLIKYRILRKVRWAGSVHRKDKKCITCCQKSLWKHHLDDSDVNEKIIVRWIIKK
jgi:hypothetical protein